MQGRWAICCRAFAAASPVRSELTAQLPLALAFGAEGSVSFEPNVAPALCRAVTDAFDRRDEAGFQRVYRKLMALNILLAPHMTPRSVKAALGHLGFGGTQLRRPYLALDALGLDPTLGEVA